MKHTCLVLVLAFAAVFPAVCKPGGQPFEGRWDMTVVTPKDTYPSWMEVTQADGGPAVRVVGRVSSVHPAKQVKLEGQHLTFVTSEWFGRFIDVNWDFTLAGNKLTGIQKRSDGVQGKISAVTAPKLDRKMPAKWGEPEPLFNGKNLEGWIPDDPSKNHWKVTTDEVVNESPGANIRSTRKLNDFKLHVEYNCPKDGNSGIYLRGRYEVQVAYEPQNDEYHGMASLYGFFAPQPKMPDKPGEWETFDITLVGRTVTVVRNGTVVIDNKEIPGITGGALESHEGEPGYIYIQGDHTGSMKYRNVTVSVPK
jgi:Domain of Unknown Function (DUF1080)